LLFGHRAKTRYLGKQAKAVTPTSDLAALPEPSAALRWSGIALVVASWISAASFGLYIIAFYLGNAADGRLEKWNSNLPGLYAPHAPVASASIAAHFATGAIILALGPLQLIGAIRRRFPSIHRWFGRLYVLTGGVAGVGGLGFIAAKGTIGGGIMDLGFGLYGVLMVIAAAQTYRYARARQWDRHRAWAIRLFALAIGSWLYRMDYGFWLTAAHRAGHTSNFRGPFDRFMAFFFYLPNLALVELFLRSRDARPHPFLRASAIFAVNAATVFVAVGTYYFLRYYWGPAILHSLLAQST
jgi:hypothetical protein